MQQSAKHVHTAYSVSAKSISFVLIHLHDPDNFVMTCGQDILLFLL